MSTILRETAMLLVEGEGRVWEPGEDRSKPTPDNPQAYVVFEFRNLAFGHLCYGVAYSAQAFAAYQRDHQITAILWRRPEVGS